MEQISTPEKIDRFKSFYAMELSDGPLVGFFLGSYYPLNRYQGASSIRSGPVSPEDIRPEPFRADYARLADLYTQLGGDTIWSGAAFWGIPWMEALSGCAVEADHGTGSMRSVHPDTPPAAADIPAFSGSNPWAQKAGEFLDLLSDEAFSFPLGTTLMRGFSDLLSALYGTTEFVYRLYDGEAETALVMDRLVNLWVDFASYQLDRIPDFHGGVGSYFYNMWMPGRGVWIQEDASAILSPQMFETHIMGALSRAVDAFDTVIIHLHPSGYIPVDPLLDTGLAAIELHLDRGGPPAEELLPYYRRIQSRKPLVIWGDMSDADLRFIRNNLDLSALTVLPVVESAQEAERAWEVLKG